jgi:Na+/melibiose symporter-like transporter
MKAKVSLIYYTMLEIFTWKCYRYLQNRHRTLKRRLLTCSWPAQLSFVQCVNAEQFVAVITWNCVIWEHSSHNCTTFIYIVAYFLKAGTVEPEKQPLLANGSETTFIARQQVQNKWDKQLLLGSHQCANGLAEYWSLGNPIRHRRNSGTATEEQCFLCGPCRVISKGQG